jgi:hypothetical protein
LLLQNRELDSLPPAQPQNLAALRVELEASPNRSSFLRGREFRTWQQQQEYDLTSLHQRDTDALTAWLGWCATVVYHRYFGQHKRQPITSGGLWKSAITSELTDYAEKDIAKYVTVTTTVLAPALPALAVSVLFFVTKPMTRLGLTVLLSFVFSAALAVVGVPRRIDSFVATTTFTALLIVFVSSNQTCKC